VAFKENYQQPVNKKENCKQQSWWIPKWLIATSLAISKQSHILHSLQAPQRYLSCRPAGYKKNLPVAWLNHPKPVQVCQDRCINGLDQEKPVIPTTKGILDKNCCLSCGQPFRDYSNMKLLVFKSKVKMTVQTLLPYGRKKGLFGHIVAKSRKA